MSSLPSVKAPGRQRGTILITVMLLFAIGAYMATEITYRQRVDIQRTSSVFAQAQAYEYVLGAEEIAKFGLRRDFKKDKDKEAIKDHPKEDWGISLAQAVDGGTIEGQVVDLQGRFNVNWLITSDEANRNKLKKAFINLLSQLKIPKEQPAQAVVDQLVDLVDEDSTPTYPDGKEETEYMLEEPPRRSGNRILMDISELLLIPALTPEELEILAPFIATLPPNTELNRNTASTEVLSAFECIDAAAIEGGMPEKGYDSDDEVLGYKTEDPCEKGKEESPITLGFSSEFFELNARSVVNGKTIKVRSVLYRNSEQDSNIDVKVIYRKQVDPYSNV